MVGDLSFVDCFPCLLVLKRKDARVGEKFAGISLPFWLSCIWNILWIVFFSYEKIGLSVIFIGLLLLTLLFILGTTPRDGEKGSLLLSITFGLYGGWLFVATFVNVGAYVEAISFEKFGLTNELFYSILVVLLLLTAFIVQKIHKNRFFSCPRHGPFSVCLKNWGLLKPILFFAVSSFWVDILSSSHRSKGDGIL